MTLSAKRLSVFLAFTMAFALAQCAGALSPILKYKTRGVYTDKSGAQFAWSINDNHTLLWEGVPYIPVGGVFVSRYLSSEPKDENFKADTLALDAISAKGVTDIIVKSRKPLTGVDPAALQKLADYLDDHGFKYGIEISDGPKSPLRGTVISPNRFRLAGPTSENVIVRSWKGVDSAVYIVLDRYTGAVIEKGLALPEDGRIKIALGAPLSDGQILMAFPRKVFDSAGNGGVGDLWTDYNEYRDRLLGFFGKVKFGRGLRFFLEPFTCDVDFHSDNIGIIPDSRGFRLGFEGFLQRKRSHEGTIDEVWGLQSHIPSIEVAARLMPLWFNGRGANYAYDRETMNLIEVDTNTSQLWGDLAEYRDSSFQGYMNSISDVIKKQVADVPVIFRNKSYDRIFCNPYGIGGFDGLGAVSHGIGEEPANSIVGPAYALVEESAKATWFVAAGCGVSANPNNPGFSDENQLFATLDTLREAGCRGFFLDNLYNYDEKASRVNGALADDRQLDWLSRFSKKAQGMKLDETKPTYIEFPMYPASGGYVKRLAPNTWWLPSLRLGKTAYIGDGLYAYSFVAENDIYIWSGIGDTSITFGYQGENAPVIEYPQNARYEKLKDKNIRLGLTDSPLVLSGVDFNLFFPLESAERKLNTLEQLIPIADAAKIDVKAARDELKSARTILKQPSAFTITAYQKADLQIQILNDALGSDIWVEGESSTKYSFDGVRSVNGASAALALVVDTDEEPPLEPYSASYAVNVPQQSSVEVWIVGSLPSESSPISVYADGMPIIAPAQSAVAPIGYAPGMAWYQAGSVNFTPGKHSFTIRLTGKRAQGDKYFCKLDAIVLSSKGFKPNGVQKPF